jgi:NitT/TauT family transport system ATP-binding protein
MLVAFQMFASRLSQPMLRLVGTWQQFQQARVAIKRLGDVMDMPTEPHTLASQRGSSAQAGRIEFQSVSFRYSERHPWLYRNLSLAIRPGQLTVLVGPSGCGKSTLLYLVGGFLAPTSGSLQLRGKPITGPGRDRGIVFQRYSLFPWLTVRGNIGYGLDEQGVARSERDRIVDEHVRLVHLEGFEDRYPRELSGGMQQRVALAQTLACQPDILLMDEPFGALDAQTRRILQDEVRRIWRRDTKTVLFVTHDVEEAVALGTRIVVMTARPGRVKEVLKRDFDVADGDEFEANPAFAALKLHIWRSVKAEVEAARA